MLPYWITWLRKNRVFKFFDEGHLIVLITGFQKKTQKTPKTEIDLQKN